MPIFSNNYFFTHSNPLSIILDLFTSHSIFFYLLVNHNTRLSFSIFYERQAFFISLPIELHVYLFQSFILYLFLCFIYPRESFFMLCEVKFTSIFIYLPFSISFYPLSIQVNLFLLDL